MREYGNRRGLTLLREIEPGRKSVTESTLEEEFFKRHVHLDEFFYLEYVTYHIQK